MLGNGKGLFGSNPMAMQADPMQAMTKPREGPSRTQGILGILGDMLATAGGGQANYMQNVMQQRQMEQVQGYRTQQAKVAQDADQQQWLARQAYERANPAPRAPDAFDIALQRGGIDPNSPQGQEMYRNRAASMASDPNDALVTVPIPGRGTYVGPRSGLSQAFGQGGQGAAEPPARLPADFNFDDAPPQQGMAATYGSPPTPTTTPEGLGAMISVHGVDKVQQWMQSGQLSVRGN